MRRCFNSGHLLRSGRGLIALRPFARSHPALSRVQTRPSSTKRSITRYEHQFLVSFHGPPVLPFAAGRDSTIDEWIPAVLECMPPSRQPGESEPANTLLAHEPQLTRAFTLVEYLNRARKLLDYDLLGYLGFELKQWSTVHNLLNSLIDSFEALEPYVTSQHPEPGFQWDINGMSLDELTSNRLRAVNARPSPIPSSGLQSLYNLTNIPAARVLTNKLRGEIILSLGQLVLGAAEKPADEAQTAMSCVFRVLARLHHLGLISDRVYQFTAHDPSQPAIRPPGLHLLSTNIMNVLSDAAWVEQEAALASAATEAGQDPPFLPFKVGVRELGPEIWMELILWCCIEHGLITQGVWLIEAMTKRSGDLAWKFESWAPLIRDLGTVQQTNISTEQSWRRPGDDSAPQTFRGRTKPPFNGLGKRTISKEILACLRDGLINRAYNGVGFHGMSPSELVDKAKPLDSILEPNGPADELRPTNRITNWSITRFMESGSLLPENDPITFEKVIRSTRSVVPPWEESWNETAKQVDGITRAQLYDETASLTGLVEYSSRTYALLKYSPRAFYQYAWLQNIVDASKYNHIRAFFEHLARSDPEDVPFFDSQHYQSSAMHKSSLPMASNVTLARLLDQAASSHANELGNWLLFNDDIDGPSIPPGLYGDQVLAPSILRFAAATKNTKLSENVIKAIRTPLHLNTLKAVVNFQITAHKWDHVPRTLEYMRDYRLKAWGHSNLATLGAEMIRLSSTIERKVLNGLDVADEKHHLERAKSIFVRFFREDFNTPASKSHRTSNFQRGVLKQMRDIFLSFPGELSQIAKQVQLKHAIGTHKKLQYVPSTSFQVLLSAIVDAYGSAAGKKLWTEWVFDGPFVHGYAPKEGGIERLRTRGERNWALGDPNFSPKWLSKAQDKAVIPSLDLVRTITQSAMREFHEETAQQASLLSGEPSPTSPTPDSSSPSNSHPQSPPSHPAKPEKNSYRVEIPRYIFKFQTKGGAPPSSESEAILDFCLSMFLRAGLTEDQVDLEIPGHFSRMRARGVFTGLPDKRSRLRMKEVLNDPWMQSYAKNLIRA